MAVRREGLAARRKELGYSREAFAELLRVDRSTVARWERGDCEPQPFLRPKILRTLRLDPEALAARRTRLAAQASLQRPME